MTFFEFIVPVIGFAFVGLGALILHLTDPMRKNASKSREPGE